MASRAQGQVGRVKGGGKHYGLWRRIGLSSSYQRRASAIPGLFCGLQGIQRSSGQRMAWFATTGRSGILFFFVFTTHTVVLLQQTNKQAEFRVRVRALSANALHFGPVRQQTNTSPASFFFLMGTMKQTTGSKARAGSKRGHTSIYKEKNRSNSNRVGIIERAH